MFDPEQFVRRIVHDGERRLIASSCSRCRAVMFCRVMELVAIEEEHVKWCALSLSPLFCRQLAPRKSDESLPDEAAS